MALEPLKDVWVPIATFLLGFLIRTFIPTRKERHEIRHDRREVSRKFKEDSQANYQAFAAALRKITEVMASGDRAAVLDAYWALREAADIYFSGVETIASYIVSNDIDMDVAKAEHLPELEKVAFKNVPDYYGFMEQVAEKYTIPSSDKLDYMAFPNLRKSLRSYLSEARFKEMMDKWGIPDHLN